MDVSVPCDLLKAIEEIAQWRRMSTECAIREALVEWLKAGREMRDEIKLWQDAGLETLHLVEESVA